jgi:hypothetical protein
MIGLTIYLNRKKLTVAGADDPCVLNAIVNAVGELGKSTEGIEKRRSRSACCPRACYPLETSLLASPALRSARHFFSSRVQPEIVQIKVVSDPLSS